MLVAAARPQPGGAGVAVPNHPAGRDRPRLGVVSALPSDGLLAGMPRDGPRAHPAATKVIDASNARPAAAEHSRRPASGPDWSAPCSRPSRSPSGSRVRLRQRGSGHVQDTTMTHHTRTAPGRGFSGCPASRQRQLSGRSAVVRASRSAAMSARLVALPRHRRPPRPGAGLPDLVGHQSGRAGALDAALARGRMTECRRLGQASAWARTWCCTTRHCPPDDRARTVAARRSCAGATAGGTATATGPTGDSAVHATPARAGPRLTATARRRLLIDPRLRTLRHVLLLDVPGERQNGAVRCAAPPLRGTPDRIRTGATALRGRRARPLHNGGQRQPAELYRQPHRRNKSRLRDGTVSMLRWDTRTRT